MSGEFDNDLHILGPLCEEIIWDYCVPRDKYLHLGPLCAQITGNTGITGNTALCHY